MQAIPLVVMMTLGTVGYTSGKTEVPIPSLLQLQPMYVFAGPDEHLSGESAVYSIVAFTSLPTRDSLGQYTTVCEGLIRALRTMASDSVLVRDQIVTVWPISDRSIAASLNDTPSCEKAVENIDLYRSREAIRDVRSTTGDVLDDDGPFLIAWTEVDERKESFVLVSNLSNVTTVDEATRSFKAWASEIEGDPVRWRDPAGILDKLRRWVDKWGHRIQDVGLWKT